MTTSFICREVKNDFAGAEVPKELKSVSINSAIQLEMFGSKTISVTAVKAEIKKIKLTGMKQIFKKAPCGDARKKYGYQLGSRVVLISFYDHKVFVQCCVDEW